MNQCEPADLLHNSGGPCRTRVPTELPVFCSTGSGGFAPTFSLPHALALAGYLKAGKGEFPILGEWLRNGGVTNRRLWTEGSQVTPKSVSERWDSLASLMRHLRVKEVPEVPKNIHFLVGFELTYTQRWAVFGNWTNGRGIAPPASPEPEFRIVPDPALTLAVVSRCCGGVLYGSRTPELDYARLTETAIIFDDPLFRDVCFPDL